MDFQRTAWLTIDGKTTELFPNKPNRTDNWMADFSEETAPDGDSELRLMLHPKTDLTLENAEIQLVFQLETTDRFFCNGFQSWSESRLLPVGGGIGPLRFFAKKAMGLYGDGHIKGIPRGRGSLHSWSWTFLKSADGSTFFIGSMDERTGFTLFLLDEASGRLTIRRDLERLDLTHSFPIFNLFFSKKGEKAATARWLEKANIAPIKATPAVGWTSWYRHFTNIDEAIVLKNLGSMAELLAGIPAGEKVFQIDDGWQTHVGDWLTVKPSFPKGMTPVSQKIRENGFIPGLWLAPFVVSAESEIFRKNPSWLLLDDRGKPLRVGWNPMWGGWFFALDFYRTEVREWLAGVFHIVLEKWGFGLVKLDFLFAACLRPPRGATRGQAMHAAMEFLRKLAGDRLILGCGVPLGSAMGLADFCRIGGDVQASWENPSMKFLRHRERVSTVASLRSTFGRWALNGRAFHNDPDVFILRGDGQRLTPVQQYTLLIVNALCGNLLFTSDDPAEWSAEARAEFDEAMGLRGAEILDVTELQNDLFRIGFLKNGESGAAYCNLAGRSVFVEKRAGERLEIGAFETVILFQKLKKPTGPGSSS